MNGDVVVLSAADLVRLLPLLIPAGAGLLALLVAGFRPDDRTWSPVLVALASLAAIAVMLFRIWPDVRGGAVPIAGMLVMDAYALFFAFLVFAMLAGASSLAIAGYRSRDFAHGEFWALMLFAATGMVLLVSARNLVLLFIGVEIMSISVYAMVGSDRRRTRPTEAALKYFLLGAFSSAFLLFGIAFLYGATGSLDLAEIGRAVAAGPAGASRAELMLGTMLLLVGFGFKTAAVPFHMWAPDAYTGAPSSVTAFMASAVKAASFAAFVRVFASALVPSAWFWSDAVAVLAAVTIIVGNLGAIAQTDLKRMLAYSGVAHAGYLLIGVRGASLDPALATPAILYYLLAYTFTSLGTFGAVVAIERWQGRELRIKDLAGTAAKHPGIAAGLAVFMLALAGVPPTAGFTAKLFVFGSVVRHGDYLLAVIGVLGSVVSLYYYLRVVVYLYMSDPEPDEVASPEAEPRVAMPSVGGTVAVAAVIVLLAGIAPDWYVRLSDAAARSALGAGVPRAEAQIPATRTAAR